MGNAPASRTGTQPARPLPRRPEGAALDFTHAHSVSGSPRDTTEPRPSVSATPDVNPCEPRPLTHEDGQREGDAAGGHGGAEGGAAAHGVLRCPGHELRFTSRGLHGPQAPDGHLDASEKGRRKTTSARESPLFPGARVFLVQMWQPLAVPRAPADPPGKRPTTWIPRGCSLGFARGPRGRSRLRWKERARVPRAPWTNCHNLEAQSSTASLSCSLRVRLLNTGGCRGLGGLPRRGGGLAPVLLPLKLIVNHQQTLFYAGQLVPATCD